MKSNLLNHKLKTSIFLTLLLVTGFSASFAQTTHQVEVSNFKFNPKNLTINVGDTVVWTNIQGTHNVDGLTSTFPDNPESFGNSVGSDWVYSFVFTKAGTYDYHCDPHASSGMTGTITVNDGTTTSSEQIFASNNNLILYPNPVSTDLHVILPVDLQNETLTVSIFNITGKQVYRKDFPNITKPEIAVNTLELTSGLYILKLQSGLFEKTERFFKQ